ncbi:hypothetical protein F2Q68_00026089 [Brassica cretica]|uniref:Uncharacterized protein n=1 Tax=Brassica cretica TaxID=69181 RepID=A0A8S9IC44_BRACR|nr:hypothetical protein F2Q68_00026089 [Brassica cretica]
MEFLETFGCIWSSKEVKSLDEQCMGATSPERHREVAVTPFQSDLARATPRCRSRLHRSEARERLGQSDTIRSLQLGAT